MLLNQTWGPVAYLLPPACGERKVQCLLSGSRQGVQEANAQNTPELPGWVSAKTF